MPLTKEQQNYRHNLYKDAVDNDMFIDKVPTEEEFSARFDTQPGYAQQVMDNYKKKSDLDLGEGGGLNKFLSFLGAPTSEQIIQKRKADAEAAEWNKTNQYMSQTLSNQMNVLNQRQQQSVQRANQLAQEQQQKAAQQEAQARKPAAQQPQPTPQQPQTSTDSVGSVRSDSVAAQQPTDSVSQNGYLNGEPLSGGPVGYGNKWADQLAEQYANDFENAQTSNKAYQNLLVRLISGGMTQDEAMPYVNKIAYDYENKVGEATTQVIMDNVRDNLKYGGENNMENFYQSLQQGMDKDTYDMVDAAARKAGVSYEDYVKAYIRPNVSKALQQEYHFDKQNADLLSMQLSSNGDATKEQLKSLDKRVLNPAERGVYGVYDSFLENTLKSLEAQGQQRANSIMDAYEGAPIHSSQFGFDVGAFQAATKAEHERNLVADPAKAINIFLGRLQSDRDAQKALWQNYYKEFGEYEKALKEYERQTKGKSGNGKGQTIAPPQPPTKPSDINYNAIGQLMLRDFQRKLVDRNVPQSTIAYILKGFTDGDIGTLIKSYTETQYQRYIDQLADGIASGNHGLVVNALHETAKFISDTPEYYIGGKAGNLAVGVAKGRVANAVRKDVTESLTTRLLQSGFPKSTASVRALQMADNLTPRLLQQMANSTKSKLQTSLLHGATMMGVAEGISGMVRQGTSPFEAQAQQAYFERVAAGEKKDDNVMYREMADAGKQNNFWHILGAGAEESLHGMVTGATFAGGTLVQGAVKSLAGRYMGELATSATAYLAKTATNAASMTAMSYAEGALNGETPQGSPWQNWANSFVNFLVMDITGGLKGGAWKAINEGISNGRWNVIKTYQDYKKYEKTFGITDDDRRIMQNAGYGGMLSTMDKLAEGLGKEPKKYVNENDRQQVGKYNSYMQEGLTRMLADKNIPEETKLKYYALFTGDTSVGMSPVARTEVHHSKVGTQLVAYSPQGDVIWRKRYLKRSTAEAVAEQYRQQYDQEKPRTDRLVIGNGFITEMSADGRAIQTHEFKTEDEKDDIRFRIQTQRDNDDLQAMLSLASQDRKPREVEPSMEQGAKWSALSDLGYDYSKYLDDENYRNTVEQEIAEGGKNHEKYLESYQQALDFRTSRDGRSDIIFDFAQSQKPEGERATLSDYDYIESILEKDPFERTEDEQQLMSDLYSYAHDRLFKNGELHTDQSKIDGQKLADSMPPDVVMDPTSAAGVSKAVADSRKAYNDYLRSDEEVSQAIKRLGDVDPQTAVEQLGMDSRLSAEKRAKAVSLLSNVANATAAEEGYLNRVRQRAEEAVDSEIADYSINENAAKGINGNPISGMVAVTLGETDNAGQQIIYLLRSADGLVLNEDGTINTEQSKDKGAIVLISQDGTQKRVVGLDSGMKVISLESADSYKSRRLAELNQQIFDIYNGNATPREPVIGTEEAPQTTSTEKPTEATPSTEEKPIEGEKPTVPTMPTEPTGEETGGEGSVSSGSATASPSEAPFSVFTDTDGKQKMRMPSGKLVETNSTGYPYYSKAEPADAAAELSHRYADNPERANRLIDNNIKAAQKELDAANKAKPSEAADPEVYDREENARQKAINDAQAKLDHWNAIKSEVQKARSAQAEAERTEQQRQFAHNALENTYKQAKDLGLTIDGVESLLNDSKATAESLDNMRHAVEQAIRKEQDRLNSLKGLDGVPTVDKDTPQDARDRGFRNDNGTKVDRQSVTDGIYGRESEARFSYKPEDEKKGHLKLIDVSQLQPSHIAGNRNIRFFLDEAQPKDRTDSESVTKEQTHARGIRPELITKDGNAYAETAPVVNSRGEVIQGNHRSAVLRRMYDESYTESIDKYKQYLRDHAEEFGLKAEDIDKMERPVLVNEIDVPDKEAIRLGQMTARDLETGGIRDIDPSVTATKLLTTDTRFKMPNFISVLMRTQDDDASISDLIVKNGPDAISEMAKNGIISDTEALSAYDSRGNLTPEAKDALKNILLSLLFKGGRSDLPKIFDALPIRVQNGIAAAFSRDYQSPDSERILKYLQKGIEVYYDALGDSNFASATDIQQIRGAMNTWLKGRNAFSGKYNGEGLDNMSVELAIQMQAHRNSQKEISALLDSIFDKVQARSKTGQTSLQFDENGNPITEKPKPMPLRNAIKQVLGIDYTPQVHFKDAQIKKEQAGEIITNLRDKAGLSIISESKEGQDVVDNDPNSILAYHKVSSDEQKRLDSEPTVKFYRSMVLIDGKLYPPMSVREGRGKTSPLRQPTEIGVWERSDENPERAKNGKFPLTKEDGSVVPAAYNPYFHASSVVLNDQFSTAYKRPNLVVVEVEVPKSELTSGYHAEGAKDAVGVMDWHTGPVAKNLPEGNKRKVMLSRYMKVTRILPDSEVAEKYIKAFQGKKFSVPDNTVTPSLRAELEKRGVEIKHTDTVKNYEENQRIIDLANEQGTRRMQVWHGSGNDFDRFDTTNHLGEGEGSQVFGAGTYVADQKELGKYYASNTGVLTTAEIDGEKVIWGKGKTSEAQDRACAVIANYGEKKALEVLRRTIQSEREKGYGWAAHISEEAYNLIKDGRIKNVVRKAQEPTLYDVEIPDDTGKNYLDWDKPLNYVEAGKIKERLLYEVGHAEGFDNGSKEMAQLSREIGSFSEANFGDIYGTISTYLGSDKAASEFLHKLGYTGIKVHAAHNSGDARYKDNWNYVVFDDNDLKINNKYKFFRTANGEVYGFVTRDGKMYLDPRHLDPSLPIHEYGHLWAAAVREKDPERWKNIVKIVNDAAEGDLKPLFDEVRKDDPTLKGDDLAEEVLMRYSGSKGMKLLDEEAKKIWDSGKTTDEKQITKTSIQNVVSNLKNAIREFWKDVADMLGIKYRDVDDIADHIIYDALSARNPKDLESSVPDRLRSGEGEGEGTSYKPKYPWKPLVSETGATIDVNDDIARTADENYSEVESFLNDNPKATVADIQRKFKVGFNAASLMHDRYNKEHPAPVKKSWKDMSEEEKTAEMATTPITHEDIDTYEGEDADMLKEWAHDYLNGDHSPQATIGYSTIYDYVRTQRDNGKGDSTTPDNPQLAGSANDNGRPGRGGGQERPNSSPESGTDETPIRGSETRPNGSSPVSGEGGDKPLRPNAPKSPTGTAGGTRPAGGNRSGGTRPNGSVAEGERPSGGAAESSTDVHAAFDSALGDLKNAFGDLLNVRKQTDAADSKPSDKLLAATPVYGMLKIGQEVYKRSLGVFMPRNIAEAKAYAKVAVTAAKVAYKGLEMFGHDFSTWLQGMKNGLSATLKQVYPKASDDDIERYIASYWDTKFKIGDVTHTIGEWANIMSDEDLRKELGKTLSEKDEAQKKAESVAVKVGDRKNIDETLPFLLPAQRDDVMKAEQQFFGKERQDAEHGYGRGMLFTNGTGTGKTYTGLGIAKRFIKQGKGRVLVVTPSAQKVLDWSRDAKHLGITLTPLDEDAKAHKKNGTEWKGSGAVVTTFANFRANHKLFEDTFDLVIYDESHKLMESKDAKQTSTTTAHYRLTNKDERYALERIEMGHPLWQEAESLSKEFEKLSGHPYDLGVLVDARRDPKLDKDKLKRMEKISQRMDDIQREQAKAIPELRKQAKESVGKTKVVFLSATPFNLRENIDYAEGYLFSYGAKTDGLSEKDAAIERAKARASYLRQWFPHGEQFNKNGAIVPKVTDAVKNSEEERAWAEHMKSLGTMSGRTLENGYDYSRDFPTVNPGMSNEYNTALKHLLQGKYSILSDIASQTFMDYNAMSVIYETMKVSASAERIKEHLSRGRKVVIFHRRVNDNKGLAQPPFNTVLENALLKAAMLSHSGKPADQDFAQKIRDAVAQFKVENAELLKWEASLDYRMPREQLRSLFGDTHAYTPDEMTRYNAGMHSILTRVFAGQKPIIDGKAVDMTPEEAGYEFGKRCFDPEDADVVRSFAPHRWREGEVDDKGKVWKHDEDEKAYDKRTKEYKRIAEEVRRGIERNIQERVNSGEIKVELDKNGKRKRHVGLFAGQDSKGQKDKDIQTFQDDDSDMNVIVVQEASGKEGISLHDVTGKHQRVMVNLALPQSPIAFIQGEGRTYRVGQKSNAIFEYPLLGIDNELMLWGGRFNGRAETTENMALGDEARGLREAISRGVLVKSGVVPLDGQGVGGREFDTRDELRHSGFDAAVDDYNESQRNAEPATSLDDIQTPEPLGFKMVEFANMQEGDRALEPSAGNGNISRYIPSNIQSLSVEPNDKRYNHLMLITGGVERGTTEATGRKTLLFHGNFEDLGYNKYDTILMSAPFGSADTDSTGKLAKEHIKRALGRLDDSGRLVAVVQRSDTMDAYINNLVKEHPEFKVTGEVILPDFVNTMPSRIVVIDRLDREEMRDKFPEFNSYDLSKASDMNDFFKQLKDVTMPNRTIDPVAKDMKRGNQFTSSLRTNDFFKAGKKGYEPDLHVYEDSVSIEMNNTMRRKLPSWRLPDGVDWYRLPNGEADNWISPSAYFSFRSIKSLDQNALVSYDKARKLLAMTDKQILERCILGNPGDKAALYANGIRDYCKAIVRLYKGLTGRTENELDRAARGEDINNKTPITAGQRLSMDDVRKVFEENNEGDTEEQTLFDKVFSLAKTLGLNVSTYNDSNTGTAAFYASDNTLQINTHFWNAKRYIDSESGDEVVMSPKVRAQTLLHELIHSVTAYADYLYDQNTYSEHGGLSVELQHDVENLRAVYHSVLEHPKSYLLKSRYALTNQRELIAEMANPNVRNALQKMGVWTRIKNAIIRFFTHRSEAQPLIDEGLEVGQSTIGTELSKILDSFLEHFDMNAYRAFTHTYGEPKQVRTEPKIVDIPKGADQHSYLNSRIQRDGLDGALGHEGYNTLMRDIFTHLKNQGMRDYVRDNMWRNHLDLYKTVGDYLSEQATKEGNPTLWQDVQGHVNVALAKAGYNIELGLRQTKYFAWLAQRPSDPANPLKEAERVAMQRKIMSERIEQPISDGEFQDFTADAPVMNPPQGEGRVSGGTASAEQHRSVPDRLRSGNGSVTVDNAVRPTVSPIAPVREMTDQEVRRQVERDSFQEKFATPGTPLPPTATPTQHFAKQQYEDALSNAGYVWKEAHVDYMQSAQELAKAILGEKGSLKDKMKESEDYLSGENQLSSRSEAMGKIYRNGFMQPLEKAIQSVLPEFGKKTKEAMRQLQLYMINKSGLERNRVLYMRDFVRNLSSTDEKRAQQIFNDFKDEKSRLDDDLDNGNIRLDEYFRQLDDVIATVTGSKYEASKHDYSGRTALYKNGKNSYDDDKAIQDVMAVEDRIGSDRLNELWNRTEAAAQFSVNLQHECGLISEGLRDYLNDEFKWYVPMRNFDQTMAEDVYGYMMDDFNAKTNVGPVVSSARGRTSLSNVDIFAQLGALASKSISHSLHNQMVNQRFLNFIHNHYDIDGKDRLVTEVKHWIEKGADGKWHDYFPPLDRVVGHDANGNPIYEPIPESEIGQAVDDWERDLKAKKANGMAKLANEHNTIPYRFIEPSHKSDHIVVAYQNGQKHVLIVNGNPRAAQAINGKLNPTSNNSNPFTRLVRVMSQLVTTYSPDFMFRNTSRDAFFAAMNNFANEGVNYWRRYAGNYTRILTLDARHGSFFHRWKKGTLDMNNTDQRLFKEFMDNGGVTGWAGMEDIEKWQKEIMAEVKSGKAEALKTAFQLLPNALTTMNEHAENLARFATYMTSRKMGRSITRSVADAKEVSVNFNRKGAGKKSATFKTPQSGKVTKNTMVAAISAQWLRNNIMFYNAGMQGLNTMAKNIKYHPARTAEASALFMVMGGLLIPALNQFLQNQDDDKKIKDPYSELPEYLRRQNICIYTGNNNFVTIPLPIELRALYGIGDMIAGHTTNPELNNGENIAYDALKQISQISPLDFMGENDTPLMAIVPASVKPLIEAGLPANIVGDNALSEGLNRRWNGMPIRRSRNSWDTNSPAWQRAFSSTGDAYVGLAKKLDKLTSDVHSENAKGSVDIDPAQLQHYVTSYTGGIGTTANNIASLLKEVLKEPSASTVLESQHTPMLRTLHYTPTEQNRYYRTRSKWFKYKAESEKFDADLKALRQDGYTNPLAKAKSISNEVSVRGERNRIMKNAIKRYNNYSKVIKATNNADLKNTLSLQRDQLMEQTVNDLDKLK